MCGSYPGSEEVAGFGLSSQPSPDQCNPAIFPVVQSAVGEHVGGESQADVGLLVQSSSGNSPLGQVTSMHVSDVHGLAPGSSKG